MAESTWVNEVILPKGISISGVLSPYHFVPNDNLNLMVIQYDTIIAMEEYGKTPTHPSTSGGGI